MLTTLVAEAFRIAVQALLRMESRPGGLIKVECSDSNAVLVVTTVEFNDVVDNGQVAIYQLVGKKTGTNPVETV